MKKYSDIAGDGGSKIVEQVTETLVHLNKKMADIKYKVAILSGKGGVGKSTVTALMAMNMANLGYKVGVLDTDLNGPSIPKLLGIERELLNLNADGIAPADGILGIKVMSLDLFMCKKENPVMWHGPSATHAWLSAMEATAVREMLTDTEWGKLDFLFFDLPPMLSRMNDISGLMPQFNGCIIVTIPSEISHIITLKTINSIRQLNIPILGLLENMRGFHCPYCGRENSLFGDDDIKEAFEYMQVPYFGKVPFDQQVAKLSDGMLKKVIDNNEALPLSDVFSVICQKTLKALNA
jgi:ATP-binding protein involved in chromosome partitioning